MVIQYYHILLPHFYVGSRFQMSHPLARQSLPSLKSSYCGRLHFLPLPAYPSSFPPPPCVSIFISSPSLRIHLHFLPLPAYPSSFPPPPCVSIFISSPSLRIHLHFLPLPAYPSSSPPPPCVSITIIVSPTYHSSH